MSRVGKYPVAVPKGVDIAINGQQLQIKGKLGQFSHRLPDVLSADMQEGKLVLTPRDKSKVVRTVWGTNKSLVDNLVQGVANGFTINLDIVGVGYRAAIQGNDLVLQLGYSHEVRFAIPKGITIKCEKPTSISVFGADKQQVGQVAAVIRGYRPPEPYKGKGIKYDNETILRKEGKKK